MEKHIYFVRHGQSNANVDGMHRGPSAELTDEGKRQADFVGKRIAAIGVEALVSSSYLRARQTAAYIEKHTDLAMEETDMMVERRRPSFLQGKNVADDDSKAVMQEIFERYDEETHRHSDEENFSDLRERANAALGFLETHPAERICVVTHGLFLRALFCSAFSGPAFSGRMMQNALRGLETDNTGISHFVFRDNQFSATPEKRWIIVNWNDSEHLGETSR